MRFDAAEVQKILEHAHDVPWTMQDIGLLGLRLDDRREYRLHVWAPDRRIVSSVIHDHPFDFVSRVIVGELSNARYSENRTGMKYLRERYAPGDEDLRTTDFVQLSAQVETYRAGDEYAQMAHELHDSDQRPGTVTVFRMTFRDVRELTVCRPEGAPWVSGAARPATSAEIEEITAEALALFSR